LQLFSISATSPATLNTAFFSYFFLFPKDYLTDIFSLDDLPNTTGLS
jgi:hypothetical protein